MQGRRGFGAAAWVLLSLLMSSTLVVLAYGRAGSTGATYVAVPREQHYHPPTADLDCVSCHPSAVPPVQKGAATAVPGQELQISALPPEASLAHWWFGCDTCHTLHAGTTNLHLISEVIDTDYLPPEYAVKTGLRPVVFLNHEGPNSYADGDAVYDGVCEVCHTKTAHHRGDPSGDHTHFPGVKCTSCHDHAKYFQPTGITNHPQAVASCSNCHLGATGQPDLPGIHGYRCQSCHPSGLGGTILGPLGTWQKQCTECHNPSVAATGNLQTPTTSHRCILCHGAQRSIGNPQEMHREHIGKANCVVCHGFIPDTGTAIGSANRAICAVCHGPERYLGVSSREFHEEHGPKGASCLECHGGVRPPVDVITGTAVGTATNVCQVCHPTRSPSEFSRETGRLHKKHTGESIDCGACHMAANLQDDRSPMPAHDDPVRASLDRTGYRECGFCHGSSWSSDPQSVHLRHVAGQSQWCYNCHQASDSRPRGLEPPVTQPAEACRLCHGSRQYASTYPFSIHEKHADKEVKCYACHQLTPPLFNWPAAWMSPDLRSGGGSGGSGGGWGGGWSRGARP